MLNARNACLSVMQWFQILLVSSLLLGCATRRAELHGQTATPEWVHGFGFSVRSPQGNWTLQKPSPFLVAFTKSLESSTHTFRMSVSASPIADTYDTPESFMAKVAELRASAVHPSRWQILQDELSLDPRFSESCVRYHAKYEVRDARTSVALPVLVEQRGYEFIHPLAPHLVIDINYVESGKPSDFDPTFRAFGEGFISSLLLQSHAGQP